MAIILIGVYCSILLHCLIIVIEWMILLNKIEILFNPIIPLLLKFGHSVFKLYLAFGFFPTLRKNLGYICIRIILRI